MKKQIYVVTMKFRALNSGKYIQKGDTINTIIGAYTLEYEAISAIVNRKGENSRLDFDGTTYFWTDRDGDIEYAFEAQIKTSMLYE